MAACGCGECGGGNFDRCVDPDMVPPLEPIRYKGDPSPTAQQHATTETMMEGKLCTLMESITEVWDRVVEMRAAKQRKPLKGTLTMEEIKAALAMNNCAPAKASSTKANLVEHAYEALLLFKDDCIARAMVALRDMLL